jgi:imidazolonepropionase-like amidohydrolase
MPGLIDTHAHVRDAEELRQALRFGVTTMLDMGTSEALPPAQLFALRAAARVAPDMSDLRAAGYMAIPPGTALPTPTVFEAEQARRFVEARREEGSDYLKIYLAGVRSAQMGIAGLDQPTVTALVETAHTMGMLAVAHVETLDDVHTALSAGIDGLAHVWRRGGGSNEISRRIAERGVFVTATLAIPDGYLRPEARTSLIDDGRFQNVMSESLMAQLRRPVEPRTTGGSAEELRASLDAQVAAVQALGASRTRLLVGTDASRNNIAVHGITMHRELEVL